ncbi:hypothetical protein BCV70DRAFT_94292 [Testicularia cyperi]|uniref:Amino acid transporter transmembrane domain-containing protein n=1 Tax=Testicularia cyperi TaxID=1882483 RepID=A0A317XRD8_9BASI|nr:hypothetical protein BCV70DRAFT_94292 [Testicularia cyperi]
MSQAETTPQRSRAPVEADPRTQLDASSENAQYPTVSTQPSHISILHTNHPSVRSSRSASTSHDPSEPFRPNLGSDSLPTLAPGRSAEPDELEEADSDTASEFHAFLQHGRIQVGQTWDDSSEDETPSQLGDRTLPLSSPANDRSRNSKAAAAARRKRRTAAPGPAHPESYLQSLRPSREHRRAWWKFLTNPGAPASLSAPHVSANLFSASLHPAVLLSMPHYFARTGVLVGTIALVGVAILGGVGGGLWVVLSRYVNGNSIEAIVGSSFGRYTKWKGGLGRALSGILLALYALGSAIIGYFALADLLLQVFFNYSPRGVPLHDRAFVTLVVGGIISSPLVIFPLAKRNVIRLNTFFSLTFYPVIVTIILVKIYARSPPVVNIDEFAHPSDEQLPLLGQHSRLASRSVTWPNADPRYPPSIWAPISLLPLLTLSACPLQILAHQRSLRRIGTSGSNVKAFITAQAGQVLFIIVLGLIFGVAAGTNGVQRRWGKQSHPNLFASLPNDDHLINFARVLFVAILVTHLAICLITSRSSWGRVLRLLDINPLRRRKPAIQLPVDDEPMATSAAAGTATVSGVIATGDGQPTDTGRLGRWKRQWGKPARNALAGVLLWTLTASSAYLSGAGGFRRSEKDGEEARFTRASEVLGLMGAGVGFVLPGLVWTVIFHIRRPRAILPPFASEIGRTASAFFVGPQSMLARNRRRLFGHTDDGADGDDERAPLLDDNTNQTPYETVPDAPARSSRHSTDQLSTFEASIPSHLSEQTSEERDEATTILLARKERQLQRRTRGKRIWQDIVVFAAVLPFGFALLVLGALELAKGGY